MTTPVQVLGAETWGRRASWTELCLDVRLSRLSPLSKAFALNTSRVCARQLMVRPRGDRGLRCPGATVPIDALVGLGRWAFVTSLDDDRWLSLTARTVDATEGLFEYPTSVADRAAHTPTSPKSRRPATAWWTCLLLADLGFVPLHQVLRDPPPVRDLQTLGLGPVPDRLVPLTGG